MLHGHVERYSTSVRLPYVIAQMAPLASCASTRLPSVTAHQASVSDPCKPILALLLSRGLIDGMDGGESVTFLQGLPQTASACCGIIPLVPTRGLQQTQRYHQSHKRHWGGPGVKGRMVTEQKKRRTGMGPPFSSLLFGAEAHCDDPGT